MNRQTTAENRPQLVRSPRLSIEQKTPSASNELSSDREVQSLAARMGIALVTLHPSGDVPSDRIRNLSDSAAVIVCGPRHTGEWRAAALAAGAFGCFSEETSLEDRVSLMMAAVRYRAALQDTAEVKKQCERICFDLVKSFGSAMEELGEAKGEAGRLRDFLHDTEKRILRALL